MKSKKTNRQRGFSLIELLIGLTVILVLLAIVSSLVARAMGVKARESRKVDALVSAQAALNVMSREIGNAGFGILTGSATFMHTPSNGIVIADSNATQIHVRSNFDNVGPRSTPPGSTVLSTNDAGEDITFFFDPATNSIVRYDPNAPAGTSKSSVVVNRVSNVTFQYFNYTTSSSTVSQTATPTTDTARVRITVLVTLEQVVGQANPGTVTFTSDVTLRDSSYMLRQY